MHKIRVKFEIVALCYYIQLTNARQLMWQRTRRPMAGRNKGDRTRDPAVDVGGFTMDLHLYLQMRWRDLQALGPNASFVVYGGLLTPQQMSEAVVR